MSPLQRRTFALLIFLLVFILFYEARGTRLIQSTLTAAPPKGAALREHFSEQTAMGCLVAVLGLILIFALRPRIPPAPFTRWELSLYALGIGILIGTALVSWSQLHANL